VVHSPLSMPSIISHNFFKFFSGPGSRLFGRVSHCQHHHNPDPLWYVQNLLHHIFIKSSDPACTSAPANRCQARVIYGYGHVYGVAILATGHDIFGLCSTSGNDYRRLGNESLPPCSLYKLCRFSLSFTSMNFQSWRLRAEGASLPASRTRII
jgi:hypothetical protein